MFVIYVHVCSKQMTLRSMSEADNRGKPTVLQISVTWTVSGA